ncbi:MAG: hypothetical protein RLZZ450_3247 [Pseudomonadota bacterium]|jgi:nitroreductase
MTLAALELSQPPFARTPDAKVDAQFVERWSRRAISDRPLSADQVATLFEAARWAPSASNLQPWLFITASQPDTLAQARTLLKEQNQRWASRAPLLVFIFAQKRHPETGAPVRTAAFDTGAAWQSLALQAHKLGLVTRAMGGIHHELVYGAFNVPAEDWDSQAAVAVGYPGALADLHEDFHSKEKPNQRKPVREFVFEGRLR